MRRLLYVPVIHDAADLGHAGPGLTQASAALVGERRWATHKETVRRFWQCVGTYLRSADPGQLKVYQDGLAAQGETGRRIVEEAAKRGSRNYQLVLDLLQGGAELRQTEDPVLLLREHKNAMAALEPRSAVEPQRPAKQRLQRDHLLAERDRFIATAINATLKEGEVGLLFVGADHNVAGLLASDISIETVKDPRRVRAYVEGLFGGRDDDALEELSQYLAAPVGASEKRRTP